MKQRGQALAEYKVTIAGFLFIAILILGSCNFEKPIRERLVCPVTIALDADVPNYCCDKGEGNDGEGCDPGNHPDKGNNDEDDKHPLGQSK
ncbi:MAG: hypothetical protein ACXABD_15485 [Candidatus Thorarchaeota archaeon]|jgi:hypothetical protein